MARAPLPEYLVLDLETIPDLERWHRPETPENVEPPFPPTWAHRIVVVGYVWLDADYRLKRAGVVGDTGIASTADERERALLRALSSTIGTHRPVIVTYNGRSFDLPVIALRSLCHAIPLPWYYRDKELRHRYSELGHLDLCDWLADHGAVRAGKLDAIARLVGLPGKGQGIDGSQVENLYRTGQLEAVERYCLADVAQTAMVFLRFRLLQGRIEPATYRERAGELLSQLAANPMLGELVSAIDRSRVLGPEVEPDDRAAEAASR